MNKAGGILARWYGDPIDSEQAEILLRLAQEREQEVLKRLGKPHTPALLRLIALHWQGEPVEDYYLYLAAKNERSAHMAILKPLVYGQLLMSRRLAGAMDYLDEAFAAARQLLSPEEYFIVMKRHQLLRTIPLSSTATPGDSLNTLLTTAAVIVRLQEGDKERSPFTHDPNDTYG